MPIAYSGIPVIGIESNYSSIKSSRNNAKINSIDNIKFIHEDVEVTLKTYLRPSDTLIVDPPRKGLSKRILEIIQQTRPSNIIYQSCNQSTLSRDICVLTSSKLYRIDYIKPFDFFPQTAHIECLIILVRLNS